MRRPTRPAVAALAATALTALAIVAQQPVTSDWTTYADSDGFHVSSSLNIFLGERTRWLVHPALPMQELLAVAFGTGYAAERASGSDADARSFADRIFLDVNRARPYYRTLAVALYLAGALAVAAAFARLLRSWLWGYAGAALWLVAPDIPHTSIQYRADVPLAAAMTLVGILIAQGYSRRDGRAYGAAAVLTGFAMTLKLPAAFLLAPLAAAIVIRTPPPGAVHDLVTSVKQFIVRHRATVVGGVLAWTALAVVMNVAAWPWGPTPGQRRLVALATLAVAAYAILALAAARMGRANRFVRPYNAAAVGLVAAGVLVPITLAIGDGIAMLEWMKRGLLLDDPNSAPPAGSGVGDYLDFGALYEATGWRLLVVAAALCAAAYGARKRVWWPALLALAAAAGAVAAVALLGGVATAGRWTLEPSRPCPDSLVRTVAARLSPGEGAVAATPTTDTMYRAFVVAYGNYTPPYQYRFVAADSFAREAAAEYGLRLRYYVGPEVDATPAALRTYAGATGVRPFAREAGCIAARLIGTDGGDGTTGDT